MTRVQRLVAGLIVCGCLSWTSPARADVVVDWNLIASQTIGAGTHPGPSGLLDFAMVHVAMHDAIQAFDHRYDPYAIDIPNATGSPIAAAAAAAHDVLVALFPLQMTTLNTTYNTYLSTRGLTGNAGLAAGHAAATAILTLRHIDASYPPAGEAFFGGTAAGEWRPTVFTGNPPVPMPMVATFLVNAPPFTLKASDQFRASPPPSYLGSGDYVKDYEEVKALGCGGCLAPTDPRRDLARFYSDNAVMYWNRTLRLSIAANVNDLGDSARLFALVNMAMSDAVIGAWNSKRYWNFWRPVTAIHEGDNDGNPRTTGDPSWQPLIVTPNYPEYTSGANSLSGSATRTLELFFRTDKMTFSITSAVANLVQNPRTYSRFSDAADDVVVARIYEGIHFRTADEVARRIGEEVANWAFSHFLRPAH
jgi:hypothetical protein